MRNSLAGTLVELAERASAWPPALLNRVVGASLLLPSGTVLALSRHLTPAERGYGTHTQLGLGECTMLHFTGYPCPMCGMTTTFALLAHFRPVDALLNQPFGPFLFAGTAVLAVVGLLDLASGAGVWRRLLNTVERVERALAVFMLLGLIGGWLYKILVMHPELLSGALDAGRAQL